MSYEEVVIMGFQRREGLAGGGITKYADTKLKIPQRDFERPLGIAKRLDCSEDSEKESENLEIKQTTSEEEEEEFD